VSIGDGRWAKWGIDHSTTVSDVNIQSAAD
jgi:hypothetical protein